MNRFINKIFGNLNKKEHKQIEANVGLISKMPQNIFDGKEERNVYSTEFKNQLENEIK